MPQIDSSIYLIDSWFRICQNNMWLLQSMEKSSNWICIIMLHVAHNHNEQQIHITSTSVEKVSKSYLQPSISNHQNSSYIFSSQPASVIAAGLNIESESVC